MSKLISKSAIFILISMFVIQTLSMRLYLHKRKFESSCDGKFDLSQYARLDRVCEDCLELYKDYGLHETCKSNCFNNVIFTKCATSVLRESDANTLIQKVKEISPPKSKENV
uniref:Ion transport peptide-like protein n=1 Tax=Tetranychus urticae TaxID=32264 RepID=T1KUT4_TETUR